jgi:hypothetical protein
MPEVTDLYLDLVRRHPRPNDDQITAFARFVATDHSWYKHLPRTGRGEPFFFYLDPHVHELFLDGVEGNGAWRPIIREIGRFPFPTFAIGYQSGDVTTESIAPIDYLARRATTAEWRERYGIFNYWNHGPPDQPTGEALEAADRGLRYTDDHGRERRVPPEALERGLVYLRATIFPSHLDDGDTHLLRQPDPNSEAARDREKQFEEMFQAMARVVAWAYDAS